MSTTQVNYLNIGLMIISAVFAFWIPFELFLFAYAVLGPLHYLTEISWLHKRQYFSPGKKDYLVLIVLTILITIPAVLTYSFVNLGQRDAEGNLVITESLSNLFNFFRNENPATMLIFFAFAISLVFVLIKNAMQRFVAFILLFIIAIILRTNSFVDVIFAIFLPTLIHVFIFTGLFILVGALKSNSTSGILSIVVFVACAVSFFVIAPDAANYQVSNYAKGSYDVSFFSLNKEIFRAFLHVDDAGSDMIYASSTGILITRFIAYAYTYHYLNWFSKTSIIKWHDVPRSWLVVIFTLWIAAVALYYTNYELGLMCLYFLSFLHVVLEFPLNIQSMKQIGEQLKLRFSSGRTAPE